jgi:NitT/TauT family transport system substrate-binding protein
MRSYSPFRRLPALLPALALLAAGACSPPAAAPAAKPAAGQSAPAPGAPPQSAPAGLTKLRVTQSVADSVAFIPIYVARYFNFFGDENLAVDVITTAGGGPDVAALIAGEAQFTAAGPINQLALWQEGKKTLSVASFGDRLTVNLVMHKDVYAQKGLTATSTAEQKIAALRGTKVSITRRGALTDMVIRMYAQRAGLDPEKDLTIIGTGAGQPQIAAFEQGQVDVAAATTPTAETLVERGAGVMLFYNSGGEDPSLQPFTGYSILVREDYARQNPEIVRAFARAIVKANKWVLDHTAAEAAEVMHFYLPNLPAETIAKDFAYIRTGVPPEGCLSERAVSANIDLFRAAGLLRQEIKWTDIATNEFLAAKCS